jgi:S1-C subfamily serine protease
MKSFISLLLALAPLCAQPPAPSASPTPAAPQTTLDNSDIYRSVVRIEVATQMPDLATPWNAGRFSGGIGTGFLIGKNQFLTNAHVVSNAQRVLINIYGSPRKHTARVAHIAHDCDLALLEVEDFSPFEKLPHFAISETVPLLESQVRVIGYPVGGERLSVTRGVVSRIDFQSYSHSRSDSHLVVQIDAAINPGNSGGPVLQEGKVVGVAFQGLTRADNTGYIIPTPVVRRFLKDIEDGKYDHYVDLGISEFPLINPAMRAALNLPDDELGVLVTNVTPTSACDGKVLPGDVLLALDQYPVDSAGAVLIEGEKVNMNEIVERKFANDTVNLTLFRSGKKMQVAVTLVSIPPTRIYAIKYEAKPRYIVHGGLVLQPLDTNLYATMQFSDVSLRRLYADYISKGIFQKKEDIVVLTRIQSDELTTQIPKLEGRAISKINGTEITSLKQAHDILYAPDQPEFLVINLIGAERPIVLPTKAIPAANERIKEQYSIPSLSNLTE